MHPKLLNIYNSIETSRRTILGSLQGIDPEKLITSPHGKWTVSQILIHVVMAEQLSLQYMRKKALGIKDAGDTGLLEDLKFAVLTLSQKLPLKYKAPKIGLEKPRADLTLKEITNEWDKVREELKTFAGTFDESTLQRKIYKHAVVGRLNVMHAMKFFDAHLHHHVPQIKRLLNN